jgi:hypothetical protein
MRYLALLSLLLVAYFPALSGDYLFSDDYIWLPASVPQTAPRPYYNPVRGFLLGRPLYALVAPIMRVLLDYGGILFTRLLVVAAIAGAALWLAGFLQRQGLSRSSAFAAAVAVATLPSFALMPFYLVTAPYLAGSALGVWAGALLWQPLSSGARIGLARGAGAAALFAAGLCVHQHTAQMFWLVPVAHLLFSPRAAPKGFLRFAAVGALAMGAYYLQYVLASAYLGIATPRSALTLEIETKAVWFLTRVLRNAANLWKTPPTVALAAAVAAWIFVGFLPELRRARGWAILACLILSHLPGLVVHESWASYRTLPAVGSMVLLLFLNTGFRLFPRGRGAFAWGAAVVGVGLCHLQLSWYGGPLQRAEVDYLSKAIAREMPADIDLLHVIVGAPALRLPIYDELGVPSSLKRWAVPGLINLALQRAGRDPRRVRVSFGTLDDPDSRWEDVAYVDMRGFGWFRSVSEPGVGLPASHLSRLDVRPWARSARP